MRGAHLAFDLRPGDEGGNGIDDYYVDGAAAHQDLGDLERLLAGVGLRDQQVLEIDAQLLGVVDVEGVLGVDKRRHTAALLGVGDHVQRQRRLTRRLRPVDLGHPAPRDTADPGDGVECDGPRRDRLYLYPGPFGAHAHDRALAVLTLDQGDRDVQRLLPLLTQLRSHFPS